MILECQAPATFLDSTRPFPYTPLRIGRLREFIFAPTLRREGRSVQSGIREE